MGETDRLDLQLLVTRGLGDTTYLLRAGDEAVLVDPQRDSVHVLEELRAADVALRYVLETHVHNDYVSGALEVRTASGADVVAPARGRFAFPHRPVDEGDELAVGNLRVVVMETPGHTPEHVAYVVYGPGEEEPAAVFTGGSLMVGSAGRTDLLGPEMAEELTRAQFRTLRRLAQLPGSARVLPTHGAGSFCASGPMPRERTSMIEDERLRNPALAEPDEATFLRSRLSGLLAYPAYYAHMAPINRAGPRVVGTLPPPRPLSPDEGDRRIRAGARVVDGRRRDEFARAHLPGSVNVELDPFFGSYVGWVVPFGEPVVLVLPEPSAESWGRAVTELYRVGYERVEGHLDGGVEAWRASGRPVRSYGLATVEELCEASRVGRTDHVVDVRQRPEWDAGHIEGSRHVFVGDLPGRLDELPRDRELWAVCATGHRSAMAASLLDGAGIPVRLVTPGGIPDWIGMCLEEEPAAASAS